MKSGILCPDCKYNKFHLEEQEDCVQVTCSRCSYVMRELDVSWFAEFPRWVP